MTSDLSTETVSLTVRNKVGLGLATVLGLGDIVGLFAISPPAAGEEGPPLSVLIAAGILGVITLIAVVWTWRGGDRVAARIVAGTRILSAVSSLPVFFVGNVPPGLVVVASVGIVLTLIAVWLVLSRPSN
jgi:hypothetical protein